MYKFNKDDITKVAENNNIELTNLDKELIIRKLTNNTDYTEIILNVIEEHTNLNTLIPQLTEIGLIFDEYIDNKAVFSYHFQNNEAEFCVSISNKNITIERNIFINGTWKYEEGETITYKRENETKDIENIKNEFKDIISIVYRSEDGTTFTKNQITDLIKQWLKENNIQETESIINKIYNHVLVVATWEHISTILDQIDNNELESILKKPL